MWWVVVPWTSRKSLRAESQMDIEEILKAKLATIIEEPEMFEEHGKFAKQLCMKNKNKKVRLKVKMGRLFTPQFSLKGSYVLFMTGFASKDKHQKSTENTE
ncbi:hypothetical protein RJ640_008753 [Escallonia rubra]|uniref:Uncharacterized protein n=1 Tax=Escallonia rubra TaxID=112253 RepID=A0AA88QBY3_9ASTE|nr:hypothetical protein RJ640_008753 [Escallonia rubra]